MVAKALSNLSGKRPLFDEPSNDVEANDAIKKLVSYAREVLKAAEEIAENHKQTFDFELAYGMGGTFTPMSVAKQDHEDEEGDDPDWEPSDGEDYGWISSSSMC